MCGIAGVIGKENNHLLLQQMLQVQAHRGPDNQGKWIEGRTAIGHNRLSIIDMTAASHQPFIDPTNRYILTYNGEIYNYLELRQSLQAFYPFQTKSDTEVLLASYIKWGSDCLHKLNGMFSFAIWDREKEELFSARDRFGVKPYYYHLGEDYYVFGSEIKTLFAAGIHRTPKESVWSSYLSYGSYGKPNETFWSDVNQLPGGYYSIYRNGTLQIKKWYHFENQVNPHAKISYQQAEKEYQELLIDSIKLRFRSDVPVGFNISGGLDSSALLMLVDKFSNVKNVEAFTFYCNDERYDELPWVIEMIKHTSNPLTKVLLPHENLENRIVEMDQQQDEPYGGIPTIAYATIFQEARRKGVYVLLDGQGMDEQLAGYDYYKKNSNSVIQGVTSSPFKTDVLSKQFIGLGEKIETVDLFDDRILNLQYRDLFLTKIPRALRFNDRVSMQYSTELREPFLDYRLVEYAFSLPKDLKMQKEVQKYLLRRLVSTHLSDDITYAPKRPLQTPQREWLGTYLKSYVESKLESIHYSQCKDWFQMDCIHKYWKDYLEGDNQSSFHIWQWLSAVTFTKV